MKKITYILFSILLVANMACIKDPLEDIEAGDWNNERSVINLKFENQVGIPTITRVDESTGTIELTINVSEIPDLSNIVLQSIQTSYGATSSVEQGESLNFENSDQTALLTVTSPTGKSRDYTIKVFSFEETLLGTYDITDLIVYGGTGPEYGGGGVLPMTSKPWIWPETGGPEAELDNTLTFEMTGITAEGNTYGAITNNEGADGLYADFQYVLDPVTDVNPFYRTVPKAAGTWERNYALDRIIFTFADGSTSTAELVAAGTEDLGNGLSKVTTEQALAFDINGTDDWDNIYSDYDKFVKKPRRFWIDLTKQ
ncbi:hypothetical protein SAMN04488028_104364 [Reichenbachiella agariperforans]|uniref:Uncharacterized protein n=1 Tax=Reichenbachiella agariperforans TaxID=156994 RepID=A0A1M6S181_REIAG|nr:hypothetical protein [Reichenbachiella agariperforans]SHK38433.1 hypothetical protein SAMN04488028_104364 [Reichenbachiella agariperforans]